MATKKQKIVGMSNKDNYPLFIWVVADPDDGELYTFKSKKEALDFINDELEENANEFKSGIVGTYSLVGLKKLSKRTQVIEEDVE